MNQRLSKLMALSFCLYIGTFFCMQIFGTDITFSELENRKLASSPKFTTETFLSGEYGVDFEKYIADQFPGRNTFISLKSSSELFLQKKDNNGVYVGKDGYLLQKFETPDEELIEKNINYINQFAESFNVYFMLAPTATKVYEHRLPRFATPFDEAKFIEYYDEGLNSSVIRVDALSYLAQNVEKDLYYKTDHHWTTLGAYYAYTAFCEAYNIEPLALDDFDRIVVSEDFYGTLFSKGNFTFATPDSVEIFEPKNSNPLEVTYVVDEKTTDTLYEFKYLEEKDKYSIFLDANHGQIKIKTSVNNGKKIAVIKDSYANAMIPFLAQHFEELLIIDLRFIGSKMGDFLREEGYEDVLMLYNVQNFAMFNKLSLLGK
ncbi:MAG: DHHW family protein [Cellulosilyticaceae bacterium]